MFQSTRPARGATVIRSLGKPRIVVSIHAPRAGRDKDRAHPGPDQTVSIHAPRAGRDDPWRSLSLEYIQFQSTRPARGATRRRHPPGKLRSCFNPRAPRGARPDQAPSNSPRYFVSIHAPRAGRDADGLLFHHHQKVSIHAPRAGRDRELPAASSRRQVSIHAPRAGRDVCNAPGRPVIAVFQSTRPARGATLGRLYAEWWRRVSIHAPRAGRDARQRITMVDGPAAFQSTRPARGATWQGPCSIARAMRCFNPRAPRGARLTHALPGFCG